MTENTPDQPELEPDTDPHSGFAVYDKTLLRYVGGVHRTKSAADDAKPTGGGRGRYEVRPV